MPRHVRHVALAVLLLITVGCWGEAPPSNPIATPLDAPATPGSGQPRLQVAGDSAVWLSWVGETEKGHALRYAAFDGTAWSAPTTVATGTDWFVNWADLPSVVPLPGERAAAHYLQSNGTSALAYAVRIMQRTPAGTWLEAKTLHQDNTPTEHGFVSMVPWAEDRVLAVWLDGRKMAREGGSGHGSGEMTLRSAVIGPDGTVRHRVRIDGRTCECCATSAVRTDSTALVAYRDRAANEVRDIRLARFDGTRWSDPMRLHADEWTIKGCPVNGPALAAQGNRVAAAWFTAADGVPRVRAALSTDGGRHFTEPTTVAKGGNKGRVDVVLLDDGAAAVSWLATGGDTSIRTRVVHADGTTEAPVPLASVPSAGRSVGFPKVVRHRDALYVAWVGAAARSEAPQVHVGRTPVDRVR